MDKMDDDESADRFTNASRPQFYVEEELVGTFGSMFGTSFLLLKTWMSRLSLIVRQSGLGLVQDTFYLLCIRRIQQIFLR